MLEKLKAIWSEMVEAAKAAGEEIENVVILPAEKIPEEGITRVENAAKEIFNFRFSLASGAHGLEEIKQTILKHLEG